MAGKLNVSYQNPNLSSKKSLWPKRKWNKMANLFQLFRLNAFENLKKEKKFQNWLTTFVKKFIQPRKKNQCYFQVFFCWNFKQNTWKLTKKNLLMKLMSNKTPQPSHIFFRHGQIFFQNRFGFICTASRPSTKKKICRFFLFQQKTKN